MAASPQYTTAPAPYAPSYRTRRLPSAQHRSAMRSAYRAEVEAAMVRLDRLSDDELADAIDCFRRKVTTPHIVCFYQLEAANAVVRERIEADMAADLAELAQRQQAVAQ